VGGLIALSSYRALRLGWHISDKPGAVGQIVYPNDPVTLLRFFRWWDGQIAGYDARLSLCVLIFLICEALRFRSIENICTRWVRRMDPLLSITKAMLETVQNWHARASTGDADIWTWPPEFPDPIVG
jgi:hypothetical protein